MFHVYSYGKDSPLKVILTDRQATLVNRFTDVFLEAQQNYREKNGTYWTPKDQISIDGDRWSSKDNNDYNRVAKFLTIQYKINNKLGVPSTEKDLHSDYLIKN